MPSKTKKQHRFMLAAANNPEFAKRAGIPQQVAHEFVKEDAKRNLFQSPKKRSKK